MKLARSTDFYARAIQPAALIERERLWLESVRCPLCKGAGRDETVGLRCSLCGGNGRRRA